MQGEELEPARKKAEAAGVKDIFIDDLREEFVSDYVFPMFRCGPHGQRRVHCTPVCRGNSPPWGHPMFR